MLTYKLKSIKELFTKLPKDRIESGEPIWYRGQSVESWHLEPSSFREGGAMPEGHALKMFKQSAYQLIDKQPNSDFNWLYLMQHHGVPTRLLDWSESPLVALYFALEEQEYWDKDGALWLLFPVLLNQVSGYKPRFHADIPSDEDEVFMNYVTSTLDSEQTTEQKPLAAIVARNSPRMQAQQGVFTISHRDRTPIEKLGEVGKRGKHIIKYTIPAGRKDDMLKELALLGISRFQLFPELESIAGAIKEVQHGTV